MRVVTSKDVVDDCCAYNNISRTVVEMTVGENDSDDFLYSRPRLLVPYLPYLYLFMYFAIPPVPRYEASEGTPSNLVPRTCSIPARPARRAKARVPDLHSD